ncbi:hypothetical protein SAMN04489732_105202 [Amycolatopsis saalfeldensis]|uniref:Uncharacterized protein n=1 Tax=Amycolatopsis saalfeldensis TaxID=394193 RepID=A0A1H8WJB8_9PSEU|nr:hypothetical protein SAMN04489732_105202 [Amycolatopsis saalfeldensis]
MVLVPQRGLECLSRQLNAVRANGPFCSRQRPGQAWFDGTPSDFVFAPDSSMLASHQSPNDQSGSPPSDPQ